MFAVALAALLAPAAAGTIVVPQTIEELTRSSDAVVRGTVAGQESRWSSDHHLIYTFVRVRVEESLKGGASGEIVVRRPGGAVGGIGQRVHGEPDFADGERVLLFLTRLPVATAPMYRVNGMSQGKLSMQTDSAGRELVLQDNRDVSFSREGKYTPGELVSLPLADVVARIKQAAGGR